MLTIIDEYSRECLAIITKRKLKSEDVLETLENLFISHSLSDQVIFCNMAKYSH